MVQRLLAAWGAIGATAAAGLPAAVAAQDSEVSLRVGVEQTSGDYGGSQDLSDLYVPLTVVYERQRIALRATVPYLEVELIDPVDSSTYTESGVGDVVLGLTVFDVIRSPGGVAVDVTAKVALGTADERRGLGTGETDYSLQADVYKPLNKAALVASAGYKVRGEPAGVVIEDTWLVSFGTLYRFTPSVTGAVFLDYRESSVPAAEALRELTALLSRQLRGDWRLQGYVVRGLSDRALDWGAGLALRRDF